MARQRAVFDFRHMAGAGIAERQIDRHLGAGAGRGIGVHGALMGGDRALVQQHERRGVQVGACQCVLTGQAEQVGRRRRSRRSGRRSRPPSGRACRSRRTPPARWSRPSGAVPWPSSWPPGRRRRQVLQRARRTGRDPASPRRLPGRASCTACPAPLNRAWPQPDRRRGPYAGNGRHGLRGLGAEPLAAAARPGQVEVGVRRAAQQVRERRLQRRREDAHADDQGEADHQGRRGGRSTTRVAHRVLPRQVARHPTQPQRPADGGCQRTGGHRSQG